MPMPRKEDDDDLFHDVDDIDLGDSDEEASEVKPEKKPAKKPAKKKTAKKKVVSGEEPRVKKAPKKRKKKVAPKEPAPFAESLFDDVSDAPAQKSEAEATNTPKDSSSADRPKPPAQAAEEPPKPEPAPAPPEPETNSVVHVYELGRWKRTLERGFTAEQAEAFATEYSRTSKVYGRSAVAGEKGVEPAVEV